MQGSLQWQHCLLGVLTLVSYIGELHSLLLIICEHKCIDSVVTLYHVSSLPVKQLCATRTLAALMEVINQTVGDAISDLLILETVLHARGWSIQDWEAAYTDLPNRQLKVTVKVGV